MWVPAQIHIFVELYTSEPAIICIHHMEIYAYLDCYRLTVPAHMSIFIIWYSVEEFIKAPLPEVAGHRCGEVWKEQGRVDLDKGSEI